MFAGQIAIARGMSEIVFTSRSAPS